MPQGDRAGRRCRAGRCVRRGVCVRAGCVSLSVSAYDENEPARAGPCLCFIISSSSLRFASSRPPPPPPLP